MTSKREQALRGLFSCLQTGMGKAVGGRNEILPTKIPSIGLIILRDGDMGEPEITLSPTRYHYRHVAEIEVLVQKPRSTDRDKDLDDLLVKLGTVIITDVTIGGAVDYLSIGPSEFINEPIESATTFFNYIKRYNLYKEKKDATYHPRRGGFN